jgi:hypothetical protein
MSSMLELPLSFSGAKVYCMMHGLLKKEIFNKNGSQMSASF